MSRVRLSAEAAHAVQLRRLLDEIQALRAALKAADELEQTAKWAGSLLDGEGAYDDAVQSVTQARAKYRAARRKVL